jgi:dipeptidyl aminopeptidase/acylaminoacyl peptidase
VWSAQFSPEGKRIATASADKTARVWDAESGQPLTEPLPHDGAVKSALFSPDGKRMVTASDDGIARVWDIAASSEKHPAWLPQLAEAISGQVLNRQGLLEPTQLERADVIRPLARSRHFPNRRFLSISRVASKRTRRQNNVTRFNLDLNQYGLNKRHYR